MHVRAEYIWMDGGSADIPVQNLRSKTRVVYLPDDQKGVIDYTSFPVWGFDGSSTNQAGTSNSDQVLTPVRVVNDPIRGGANFLVLCEVTTPDDMPHKTNTRSRLRDIMSVAEDHDPWFGFEQEYTLYNLDTGRPLGWPEKGLPQRAQGPYYCGVGADEVAGRKLVEDHLSACMRAGLMIYGINAEVMLGQWEFQIGHRPGFPGESADPLTVADHLIFARWLLFRIGEDYGISATLNCKPEQGDWNGAGAHTNFSTKEMRDPGTGKSAIAAAVKAMSEVHAEHIADYGFGLEKRLTGKHETCDINTFKVGDSDRGCSIRIPAQVAQQGYGYIEDRRPGANCDPYRVCTRILTTVCTEAPIAV